MHTRRIDERRCARPGFKHALPHQLRNKCKRARIHSAQYATDGILITQIIAVDRLGVITAFHELFKPDQ